MMTIFCQQLSRLKYRKSSIKPTGGLIYFSSLLEGGGGGGVFNLETMVKIIQKEKE